MTSTNPQSEKDFYEAKYAAGEEFPRTSKLYTLEFVPDAPPALEVLDIGCATGANTAAMLAKGHHVRGVDISGNAITKYTARGFDGRTMDIAVGLDFPDASFDLVFCSEVIEHLVRPDGLASEIHRVLRPGGSLVLSTPNSAFWVYRLLGIAGYTLSELQHRMHLRFFSPASLTRLLRDAGFEMEHLGGRSMYMVLPDPPRLLRPVFSALGLRREMRFRTGKSFWHLSGRTRFLPGLVADTIIVRAAKPAP